MAVISLSFSDTGDLRQTWKVPNEPQLFESPVPRGIRKYIGGGAVAALGASDETDVVLSYTFPTGFIFLPKSINLAFRSDDGTESFNAAGIISYGFIDASALGAGPAYSMDSNAPLIDIGGAVMVAQRTWRPIGQWRHFINAPAGDTLLLHVSDTTPTSTAGDMRWYSEFWEYDVEQWFNWQVQIQSQLITY